MSWSGTIVRLSVCPSISSYRKNERLHSPLDPRAARTRGPLSLAAREAAAARAAAYWWRRQGGGRINGFNAASLGIGKRFRRFFFHQCESGESALFFLGPAAFFEKRRFFFSGLHFFQKLVSISEKQLFGKYSPLWCLITYYPRGAKHSERTYLVY